MLSQIIPPTIHGITEDELFQTVDEGVTFEIEEKVVVKMMTSKEYRIKPYIIESEDLNR